MDSHWAATKGASARRRGAAWTAVFFPPLLDGDGGSGRPALLVEAEERFQGLQLESEASEGGGVFPAGVEEGPRGGGEIELEVEQPLAELVDVLATVYSEGEGISSRDAHEGVLHELQVGFNRILFHNDLILCVNKKGRRRTSCSSPSG